MYPLPELGAADFRRGGILREIEQRQASDSPESGFQVSDTHLNILSQFRFRDVGLRNFE